MQVQRRVHEPVMALLNTMLKTINSNIMVVCQMNDQILLIYLLKFYCSSSKRRCVSSKSIKSCNCELEGTKALRHTIFGCKRLPFSILPYWHELLVERPKF